MGYPDIPRYPDVVSLIPNTGIQFLDFGFNLVLADGRKNPKAPGDWGFFDPRGDSRQAAQPLPTLLRRGDSQVTPVTRTMSSTSAG